MHEFFKSNDFFNFELTRILGTAPSGGCDIAEFLQAVGEIRSGDPESWHSAFLKQAEKAEKLAADAIHAGHSIQARNAFLRASNYFRASQYMLLDIAHLPDARVLPLLQRSISNFHKSVRLMDIPVHFMQIPFQKYILPGYLYLPHPSTCISDRIPIILMSCGADSTQEELYHSLPCVGPDLGYAILTFEGPGQGILLRRDKSSQRPDWEIVIAAVLDYLFAYASQHPDLHLDTARIATMGLSLGGYYALRGAVDPRIKACVAIDGFYDMWDLVAARMPCGFVQAWDAGWIMDGVVDAVFQFMGWWDFQAHWEFSTAAWMLGVDRPVDVLRRMRLFTLRLPGGGEFLERVKGPVLVSAAGRSIYFHPEVVVGKITRGLEHLEDEEKEVWLAESPAEGGLQGKVGSWGLMQGRVFRFLDKHFGVERDVEDV
jgi:hypothetical protein